LKGIRREYERGITGELGSLGRRGSDEEEEEEDLETPLLVHNKSEVRERERERERGRRLGGERSFARVPRPNPFPNSFSPRSPVKFNLPRLQ